jgi:hypothetical protein
LSTIYVGIDVHKNYLHLVGVSKNLGSKAPILIGQTMLPRWNNVIHSLKAFLRALEQLVPRQVEVERQSPRGRRPKRSLWGYLKLLIVKEAKRAS